MNDVMSERLRILLAKRSRTRRFNLPTREPPPKDIVLAACVYADNGPHLVVVGRDCHPRSPDDIENSEIARVVDFLYSGALRLAQPFENGPRVRNCASDNLANGFVRCILNQRGTAVGDKLVQVKHRLDPSVCMDCTVFVRGAHCHVLLWAVHPRFSSLSCSVPVRHPDHVRFTPKADKKQKSRLVRFVPKADLRTATNSPQRGGTLSRKSVRTVRRSLISDARKLWRSCWRRCRKVQRSLFRKVASSWNASDIHCRSKIQSRSQQHLRKPRCGMRGDMPFG